MKVSYIVALLMIVLIVGCAAPETPPAAPPAAPPATPAAPAAPAEEAPAETEAPVVSDANQAHIDRLKPVCERGSLQSCLVLKNTYGIDWPPAVAEEPEVAEETTE